MRLFQLLTLGIAPCSVLGWYGTQKLMAEPLKIGVSETPTIDTTDVETVDTTDNNVIEPQPMANVQPLTSISQPKFSSLDNSRAAKLRRYPKNPQSTRQRNLSFSVTTVPSISTKIDRNQVRQVVSQSTQRSLSSLSLEQVPATKTEIAPPKPPHVLPEVYPETITAESVEGIEVPQLNQLNQLEAEELPVDPLPVDPLPAESIVSDITSPIADQSPIAVAPQEDSIIYPATVAEPVTEILSNEQIGIEPVDIEAVNIEQDEHPDVIQLAAVISDIEPVESYPELVQSDLAAVNSAIDVFEPDMTNIYETDIYETDISEVGVSEVGVSETDIYDVVDVYETDISEIDFHGVEASLPILPSHENAANFKTQQVNRSTLSPLVDENYILGPGDIIAVNVFNVPDYSGQYSIAADGSIRLPQLGRVLVHSMTLQQASDEIAARYAFTLESPLVSVQIVQQRPVQVAIAGEIIQPGLYTITPQGTPYPRLFTALQQAGGLTQAADLTQINVRRRTANGGQTTLQVDLLALLNNGDTSQNIFLQDGDAILIPAAETINMAALDQLSASNLRNNIDQPIDIAIVGEVNQPGPYRLDSEGGRTTLVQALKQAGGITPSANLRDIELRRKTRQGNDQFFEINLWKLLQTGDLSQDIVLQQGDTLVIPTAPDVPITELAAFTASTLSTGTIQVNVLGEVENPGVQQVRANTSLNQALLSAGGLNRRNGGDVTLIRFNPDGTVSQQPIDVDLSQEINDETNPILRPNDVIVVGRSAKAAFDDTINDLSGTFNLVWPFLLLAL